MTNDYTNNLPAFRQWLKPYDGLSCIVSDIADSARNDDRWTGNSLSSFEAHLKVVDTSSEFKSAFREVKSIYLYETKNKPLPRPKNLSDWVIFCGVKPSKLDDEPLVSLRWTPISETPVLDNIPYSYFVEMDVVSGRTSRYLTEKGVQKRFEILTEYPLCTTYKLRKRSTIIRCYYWGKNEAVDVCNQLVSMFDVADYWTEDYESVKHL